MSAQAGNCISISSVGLPLLFNILSPFLRTMANLYEDANWSQKYLEEAINKARKHVTKCKIKGFTLDRLKYYYNELKERCQQGYNTSFIDLWGLMVEYMLHDEVLTTPFFSEP